MNIIMKSKAKMIYKINCVTCNILCREEWYRCWCNKIPKFKRWFCLGIPQENIWRQVHAAIPTQAYLPLLLITVTCYYTHLLSNIHNDRNSSVRLSQTGLRIIGLYIYIYIYIYKTTYSQFQKHLFNCVYSFNGYLTKVRLSTGEWCDEAAQIRLCGHVDKETTKICCVFFSDWIGIF